LSLLQEFELIMHWPGFWSARVLFAGGEWFYASADTAPSAISHALLDALEDIGTEEMEE
jgi:hypothetical protein